MQKKKKSRETKIHLFKGELTFFLDKSPLESSQNDLE